MDLDDFRPELIWPYDPRLHPLPPPGVDICAAPVVTICLNAEWWSHVSGMIARLTYTDAWRGTDDQIHDAIESIYKILNVGRPTMGCGCCPEPTRSRFNADGTYEISYDGGVTWEDGSASDPRYTSPAFPPIEGTPGDDLRCKAANNALQAMKDAQIAFSAYLGSIGGITQLALALAGVVALVFVSGGAAAFLVPLLLELAAGIISLSTADYNAQFDSDAWDYIFCQLYCNVGDDGQFTDAQFNTISAALDGHFSGNVALTFSSILRGWQTPGLNNAARTPSTANLDCTACSGCDDVCGDWESDSDGSIEYMGDNVWRMTAANVGGVWKVGLRSVDQNSCCAVVSYALVSGGDGVLSASYKILCGVEQIEANLVPNWVVGQCVNFLSLHGSGAFVLDVVLGACP